MVLGLVVLAIVAVIQSSQIKMLGFHIPRLHDLLPLGRRGLIAIWRVARLRGGNACIGDIS